MEEVAGPERSSCRFGRHVEEYDEKVIFEERRVVSILVRFTFWVLPANFDCRYSNLGSSSGEKFGAPSSSGSEDASWTPRGQVASNIVAKPPAFDLTEYLCEMLTLSSRAHVQDVGLDFTRARTVVCHAALKNVPLGNIAQRARQPPTANAFRAPTASHRIPNIRRLESPLTPTTAHGLARKASSRTAELAHCAA